MPSSRLLTIPEFSSSSSMGSWKPPPRLLLVACTEPFFRAKFYADEFSVNGDSSLALPPARVLFV